MRTTIDVPDDLMRDIKVKAARQGETLKELVIRLFEQEAHRPMGRRRRARISVPFIGTYREPGAKLTNADVEDVFAAEDAERYGTR